MGSYDRLKPYPIEYVQFISTAVIRRLADTIGDETGLHLGTAVAALGRAAGALEPEKDGAGILMGVGVAWGRMLGLGGMNDFQMPEGSQKPKVLSDGEQVRVDKALVDVLLESGAQRPTWGTLLVISAMDLVWQAREVIPPVVPKTILLEAIADGDKANTRGGKMFSLVGAVVLSLFQIGCAGAERGAAYLSLSDQAMVTGAEQGGWSGPHQLSAGEGPSGGGSFVKEGRGAIPHSIFQTEGGEVWVRVGNGEYEWFRVGSEGGRELLGIIKRRGGVEIFRDSLREVLGLGGMGA